MARFARDAVSVTQAAFDSLVKGKVEVCDLCQFHQLKELVVTVNPHGAVYCSTTCRDDAETPVGR